MLSQPPSDVESSHLNRRDQNNKNIDYKPNQKANSRTVNNKEKLSDDITSKYIDSHNQHNQLIGFKYFGVKRDSQESHFI